MKRIIMWFLPILVLEIAACETDKNYSYYDELEKIDAYILESGLDFTQTNTGLYFLETREGTGAIPEYRSTVLVDYIGRTLDSTVFINTYETGQRSFAIGSNAEVRGLEEALTYMREGGAATIVVPSSLAYGAQSISDDIGPYSTFIYDIELYDIR